MVSRVRLYFLTITKENLCHFFQTMWNEKNTANNRKKTIFPSTSDGNMGRD